VNVNDTHYQELLAQLLPKQALLAHEYLVDLNAKQAALRAGYKAESAHAQGCTLLKHPKVAAAIAEGKRLRALRTQISADAVVAELAKIGFADMRKFVEWGPDGVKMRRREELDDQSAAAIAEVSQTVFKGATTVKFKLHSKVSALELLGRHLGVFKDHSLNVNVRGEVKAQHSHEHQHHVSIDLDPYRDAVRTFIEAALDGGGSPEVLQDGAFELVDQGEAQPETGSLPPV